MPGRSSRKKVRPPSPISSTDSSSDSLADNSDNDEWFADEVEDENLEDAAENSGQQIHSIHPAVDDIPLLDRWNDFVKSLTWVEDTFVPKIHPFSDIHGGVQENCGLSEKSTCIDVFKKFVTEDMIDMISFQCNEYKDKKITQLRDSNKLKPNSRILSCDDVSSDEIYTFHALMILMGIVKKPSIPMYWSRDSIIETPVFSECMTLKRFQSILSILHFANDETDETDKIKKIRPVVGYLLESFQSIYRPGPNICIDESLMKWHGRLSFKQFNRNKRARFGIKLYETCDSDNGYVYNFKIYVGRDERTRNTNSLLGVSGKVVLDMLGDLAQQGRSLYIDNWYSSPYLFKRLHDDKTNVCGTVRMNRRYMPKIKTRLEAGQMQVLSTPQMCFIAWKDKKLVTMLSTMHSPAMVKTNKVDHQTGQARIKPNIVLSYNNNMGGVDLSDQSICPYETTRKSIKWYIKTYFHLIDIAIFNAFVVYREINSDTKMTLLQFRLDIVHKLIRIHCKKTGSSVRPKKRLAIFPDGHFPSKLDGEKNFRKRCVLCYKQGKRQMVNTSCKDCGNVPLCVDPCFKNYHTES